MHMHDSLPSTMTRRTMLKATTATAAGAALFAGSAQATEPDQLNWCGCSQVCVSGGNGNFVVITGEEDSSTDSTYDGWRFRAYGFRVRGGPGFCFEPAVEGGVGGPDEKVLAVSHLRDGAFDCFYCNPGNCADKSGAKQALLDYTGGVPVSSGLSRPTVRAPDTCATTCDGTTPTVVEGRCGTPGEDAPPRRKDGNNGNKK